MVVLRLWADRIAGRDAAADLNLLADDIAGTPSERDVDRGPGRPEINDTQALADVKEAVAKGTPVTMAILRQARRLAVGDDRPYAMAIHRKRLLRKWQSKAHAQNA